jgi:hypothetical protein
VGSKFSQYIQPVTRFIHCLTSLDSLSSLSSTFYTRVPSTIIYPLDRIHKLPLGCHLSASRSSRARC